MRSLSKMLIVFITAAVLAGCGASKTPAPAAEKTEIEEAAKAAEDKRAVYESGDGWSAKYDPDCIEVNETEGDVSFTYTGDCAGSNVITFTYIKDRQPREVLYEKTADYEDEQVIRLEGWFSGRDNWAFSALVLPDEDTGMGKQMTAAEHNDGVLFIEALYYNDDDEERGMAVGDTMADILDSFVFTDHAKQKEFDYVPGTYVREYEEEMEGKMMTFTDTIELAEDHTGMTHFQDDISVYWTSTEIVEFETGTSYEYTIEGDRLYVDQGFGWNEFIKK